MNLCLKNLKKIHVFLFSIASSLLFANLSTHIEVKRTDTGEKYKDNQEVVIYLNQRLELEITGKFYNQTTDSSFIHLRDYFVVPIPDFIYNLENMPKKWLGKIAVPPLTDTVLTQIIYVDRPQEIGDFPFSLWAANMKTDDPSEQKGMFSFFNLNFKVETPPSPPPVVHEEPEFSAGLANSVYWDPISDANTQDVYAFDVLDSLNWRRSIRRIYRTQESDSTEAAFQNLEHGHQYGYFSKSTHLINNDTIALFSETTYSIQDNYPPSEVAKPVALFLNDRVQLSWFASEDTVSGVEKYEIYRTRNFENETCIDTVFFTNNEQDDYTWYDTQVDSGNIYVYRVIAVDRVGNQNQGDFSESIRPNHSSGNDPITPDVPVISLDPDPLQKKYISSSLDTIYFHSYFQNNQVQRLKIIAARDDTSYFENKSLSGGRLFTSEWLTPSSYEYWILDYRYLKQNTISSQGEIFYEDSTAFVEANFVNGHTYYRRLVVDFGPVQDTLSLGYVIPDCFAPEEVQNLKIQSIVTDANYNDAMNGFTNWQVQLSWTSAFDGASGVQRYHVYRQLTDIDNQFIEVNLDPASYLKTTFIDTLVPDTGLRNPLVKYRVVAEDQVGNRISVNDLSKEVSTLSLNAPAYQFYHQNDATHLFLGPDTLYIDTDSIQVQLSDFNTDAVQFYYILMDTLQYEFDFSNQNILQIPVPQQEFTSISLRAVYDNGESSIWSDMKTVIRAQNSAPENLLVYNSPTSWNGDIQLQWQKPSFDVSHYEIWREDAQGVFSQIGTFASSKDTIQWKDVYNYNELTSDSTDTLIAHGYYNYQIRKVNLFNQISAFSNKEGAYCVKPPEIISHSLPGIENNQYVFTIYWNRPKPNYYSNNFITIITVSEDSLSQVVEIDTVSENTEYTFYNATVDHNYIFRIQEIPNNNALSLSNLSKPFTVSSLVKLDPFALIPQPKGKMYLNWNSQEIIKKYKVSSFVLYRDNTQWNFSVNTTLFMDSSDVLQHNGVYSYTIYALDSLEQIVAANTKTDTMDTGSVFIPEVQSFSKKYFNNDSIQVFWNWKNRQGHITGLNKRNADHGMVQASVNPNFPDDSLQTVTVNIPSFNVNTQQVWMEVPVLSGRINNQIYFRMTAADTFNNPIQPLWSTQFFEMKSVYLDTIAPYPVKDLSITASENYPFRKDSVIQTITWTGADVEYLHNESNLHWDAFVQNIHKYILYRQENLTVKVVGEVLADNQISVYSLPDTVQNQMHQWYLAIEDSAGNITQSPFSAQPIITRSPDSPNPTGVRACSIIPIASDSSEIEYFIEIAMQYDHFEMAHKVGSLETLDRLLCRSNWQAALDFECQTGWGKDAVVDTTWFRVMARQPFENGYWESGWSEISYFISDPFEYENEAIAKKAPDEFKVHPLYPNPFNSQANIQYDLAEPGEVEIKIYNVLGRVVESLTEAYQTAGHYSVAWHGTNAYGHAVSSGVYLVQVVQKTENGAVNVNRLRLLLIK